MQIKVWIDKGFNFWKHNLIVLFIVTKSFCVQKLPVQKLKEKIKRYEDITFINWINFKNKRSNKGMWI